jgi:hypothetical protein
MAQCLPHFGRRLMDELRRVFGLACDCREQSNYVRRNGIDVGVLARDPNVESVTRSRIPPANIGNWQIARDRLQNFLNSGTTIWLRTDSISSRTGSQVLIAYETLSDQTSTTMFMNPFTWFNVAGGNSVRPALQASSERAAITMGPAMLLLHETGHMLGFSCMLPSPGQVCAVTANSRAAYSLANPEYFITRDVDAVTAGVPDVIPRGRYVTGFAGSQYQVGAAGVDWVRWPTAQQLRTGRP